MWPFTRSAGPDQADGHARAVGYAAGEWARFDDLSGIPANLNLRDRLAYFASDFVPRLARRFPELRGAPDELLLLIMAEGVEASGRESRRLIELQLGIALP